jgi:hypothetical protein
MSGLSRVQLSIEKWLYWAIEPCPVSVLAYFFLSRVVAILALKLPLTAPLNTPLYEAVTEAAYFAVWRPSGPLFVLNQEAN